MQKWINRRGGKKADWEWIYNYLQLNPLPLPKIMISLHAKSSGIKYNRYIEEPYVGKPPVGFCEGCHSNKTKIIMEV